MLQPTQPQRNPAEDQQLRRFNHPRRLESIKQKTAQLSPTPGGKIEGGLLPHPHIDT